MAAGAERSPGAFLWFACIGAALLGTLPSPGFSGFLRGALCGLLLGGLFRWRRLESRSGCCALAVACGAVAGWNLGGLALSRLAAYDLKWAGQAFGGDGALGVGRCAWAVGSTWGALPGMLLCGLLLAAARDRWMPFPLKELLLPRRALCTDIAWIVVVLALLSIVAALLMPVASCQVRAAQVFIAIWRWHVPWNVWVPVLWCFALSGWFAGWCIGLAAELLFHEDRERCRQVRLSARLLPGTVLCTFFILTCFR